MPPSDRPRAFYGWYVLAASVVIELFGLGFGIFAITTVYPYIIDTFPDWSRSTVFLPTSLIILIVGLMSPVMGWLLDRYPIRWIFVIGIAIQGIALVLFSRVQTPAQYIGSSLLLGFGMSGVTILPNQVLVSRWFHARVGLVNGIVLAATALGAALAPALITRMIEALDWRTAFMLMAGIASLPPLLAVLLVVRDRPEEMGLRPYGTDLAPTASIAPLEGRSLREAFRLPAFWMFAGAIFLGGMPCYSFNKHILVFLKELGYDPVTAADHKSFFFFVSACARLLFGWLADRDGNRATCCCCRSCSSPAATRILFLVPGHPQSPPAGAAALRRRLRRPPALDPDPLRPLLRPPPPGQHPRRLPSRLLTCASRRAPLFTAALYDHFGSYTVAQVCLTAAWIAAGMVAFGMPHALPVGATAASADRAVSDARRAPPADRAGRDGRHSRRGGRQRAGRRR
ncbi:MAG: MFS transporter [Candidatus Binatia bacterium]